MMNKKGVSETDICAKYITPAVIQAGWDEATQIRREVGSPKAASSCAANW
jgi:type I restriction enzyme R subunit